MAPSTKATGRTARRTAGVDSFTQMVMFRMGNGASTKRTEKGPTSMQMGRGTMVRGKTISSMDMVRNPGLMELFTRANILTARSTRKASSPGLMEPAMREHSTRMPSRVLVSIDGLTVEHTLESGRTTRCTEREPSLGLMVGSTPVSSSTTEKRDTVYSLGAMAAPTKVAGGTENSTVKVYINRRAKAQPGRVSGRMESERAG